MHSNIERLPIIQRGNLIIDQQCYTVTIGGTSYNLPSKEMKLLCLLAEHPGWVLTKKQIFNSIYGENDIEVMNDVYIDNRIYCLIRDLRKQLETNPSHPKYIHTIRGVGYKFIVPEE